MKRLALLLLTAACSSGVRAVGSDATAPASIAFGSVEIGAHKSLTVTVTNDALYSMQLTAASVAEPFTVMAGTGQSIGPSATAALTVDFAPQNASDFDSQLTIELTASDTPELFVRLTGTGVPAGTIPDAGIPDAGTPDAGTADAGTPDAGTPDAGPPPVVDGCDDVTNPCGGGEKCCNHECVVPGPTGLCPCARLGETTFQPGTLIIPMDACFQGGIDLDGPPAHCDGNAKQTEDDSALKAYGLVFFLLRHQVTLYTAINPGKTSPTQIDLSLSTFVSGVQPVQRYDWGTKQFVPLPVAGTTSISYRGGPFLIDSTQHDRVMQLLASDPDFAQFRSSGNIAIHSTTGSFQTAIAKTINSVPSQIALLVPANDGTRGNDSNAQILIRYLKSAGLGFPGAQGTPSAHGVIFDTLQESDFLPDYDHSNLKAGGYKLLWSPHWEGQTANTPAQLRTIGQYVAAGNDLFAECAAIATLEGYTGHENGVSGSEPGDASTRFMSTAGETGDLLSLSGGDTYTGTLTYHGLTSPFPQLGDFPFALFSGAITDYHPSSGSAYQSGVVRHFTTSVGGTATDLFSSIDLHGAGKGTVVYLAGHDYSYGGEYDDPPTVGLTAGSRLVLNTMFSLGTQDICAP